MSTPTDEPVPLTDHDTKIVKADIDKVKDYLKRDSIKEAAKAAPKGSHIKIAELSDAEKLKHLAQEHDDKYGPNFLSKFLGKDHGISKSIRSGLASAAGMLAKVDVISYVIVGSISIMAIIIIAMNVSSSQQRSTSVAKMNKDYASKNAQILSVDPTNANYQYRLKDYYIQSAYNCCSVDNYSYGYVDMAALNDCLRQGVRLLDFQIFFFENEPIVATSFSDNHYVRETYDFLLFRDVFNTIIENAFSEWAVPNPNDPLILNFRFVTNENKAYQSMANLFSAQETKFMGTKYSFESYGKNFAAIKLKECLNKIIIFVDKSNGNTSFMDCPDFYEYVNFVSGTQMFQSFTSETLANEPVTSQGAITQQNADFLSIVYPSILNGKYVNTNITKTMPLGCQFTCMMYQVYDENLKYSISNVFNAAGSSFVLKDESLRDGTTADITVPAQTPSNSYAERSVKTPLFNFSV